MKIVPVRQTPQSCHWSVPTLLMPRPYWLSATDAPWCCWNAREIVVLSSTDTCLTCPIWKAKGPETAKSSDVSPEGAVAFREP